MKKSDFERLDANLVAYSQACERYNTAGRQLWGSLIPLITEAIDVECTNKDFASLDNIVEYVNTKVGEYYQSAEMKHRLPRGRHTHDGQVVFAVDAQSAMVIDAIRWAVICDVIQEVVEGKYALSTPKRA